MLSFLLFLVRSDDICPCELSTTPSADCCCAGIRFKSQYPANCYPDAPTSILPACPQSHFGSSRPLAEWLLAELFCVQVDNRDLTNTNNMDQYQSINSTTFVPTYETTTTTTQTTTSTGYAPNQPIYLSDGSIFTLPTSDILSTCQMSTPVTFLYSTQQNTCTVPTTMTTENTVAYYSGLHFHPTPGNPTYIPSNVYDDTGVQITTGTISRMNVVISYSTAGELVSVDFYCTTTTTATTEFRSQVIFVESPNTYGQSFNSGEIGYEIGSPVIAVQGTAVGGNITLSFNEDDYSQNIFPIPLGACPYPTATQTAFPSYSLKFGMDTIGECDKATFTNFDFSTLYIARHAHPDPTLLGDWVQPVNADQSCQLQATNRWSFTFYTAKNGTVNRPFYVIDHVDLACSQNAVGEQVIATFIEIPQNIVRYIGNFPSRMARIPNDFFYPFSRPANQNQ